VEKENLTWRSFSDPPAGAGGGPIARRWNLSGTPTIYLLDARGVIRHKWLGGAREQVIDHAVEKLVREVEAGAK
jgi:hypothetical protein